MFFFENNADIDTVKKYTDHTPTQIIVIVVISMLISPSTWFNNFCLLDISWDLELRDIYLIEPFINMLLFPVAAFLFYKSNCMDGFL